MDAFGGVEPLVGEIRALRTFRIDASGTLFPLYGTQRWQDGENSAACRHLSSEHDVSCGGTAAPADIHRAPDPDCSCGIYAYGSVSAASGDARAQHLLGAVACWGTVLAGTRGVRAQYAELDAMWFSAAVPDSLIQLFAERYPAVEIFRDRRTMLAAFPPDRLDCYERVSVSRDRAMHTRVLACVCVVSGVLWILGGLLGVLGWIALRGPVLLVLALSMLERRRARRSAASFPDVIESGRREP